MAVNIQLSKALPECYLYELSMQHNCITNAIEKINYTLSFKFGEYCFDFEERRPTFSCDRMLHPTSNKSIYLNVSNTIQLI